MKQEPWSTEEDALLVKCMCEDKGIGTISKEFMSHGYYRSFNSIRHRRDKLGEGDKIGEIPRPIKNISPLISKNIVARQYYDLVKESIKEYGSKNKPNIPIHSSKVPKAHSLCLALSDIHLGKKIKINGNETYNLKISQQRTKSVLDHTLDIYYSYIKKNHIIDEIVVFLVGDILDNELIYEAQAHNIDANVVKQLLYATKDLYNILDTLSNIDNKINLRVICVKGNHGRVGNSVVSDESNWDLALYNQLNFMFSDVIKKRNVSFEIADDDYIICNVKGWTGMIKHDIPPETKTPSARSKFGGWNSNHLFDFMIGGHWHTCGFAKWNKKPIYYNGCLSGVDDLSERMAVSCDPEQIVFGISEKRNPSFMYIVDSETGEKTEVKP